MILSNTVATSVVLNGATSTVNTPADTLAPLGFSPSSNGEHWNAFPSDLQAIVPAVTQTTTTNLDWSQGGLFQVTLGSGVTGSYTFSNVTVGQTIQILTTQNASASTVSYPSTVLWVGGGSGAVSSNSGYKDLATITCIAPGSYIGNMQQHLS
jgi:hypothetical protein